MTEKTAETSAEPAATEGARERVRGWMRTAVAVVVAVLLVGDVAIYSLYQALLSRVQSQEHRLERLDKMVNDMVVANQNAEKIEGIETQVDNIETQISDLTKVIKEQDEYTAAVAAEAAKKKGRRQRRN
jgi:uncharacterized protein HemX